MLTSLVSPAFGSRARAEPRLVPHDRQKAHAGLESRVLEKPATCVWGQHYSRRHVQPLFPLSVYSQPGTSISTPLPASGYFYSWINSRQSRGYGARTHKV